MPTAKEILAGYSPEKIREAVDKIRIPVRDATVTGGVENNGYVPAKEKEITYSPTGLDITDSPMGYAPIVGDVLQAGQVGIDLSEGQFGKAALNAGLLLVPNFIEKPAKLAVKGISNWAKKAIPKAVTGTLDAFDRVRFIPSSYISRLEDLSLAKLPDQAETVARMKSRGNAVVGSVTKPNGTTRSVTFDEALASRRKPVGGASTALTRPFNDRIDAAVQHTFTPADKEFWKEFRARKINAYKNPSDAEAQKAYSIMKDVARGKQAVSTGVGNNIYMPFKWSAPNTWGDTWGHEAAHNIRHTFLVPAKNGAGFAAETAVSSPKMDNAVQVAFPGIDAGKYKTYFADRDEILARGTQLKNYFNTNTLSGNQVKEYLGLLDAGSLDNPNTLDLLQNHVTDFDNAARFFNDYSFAGGGLLIRFPSQKP